MPGFAGDPQVLQNGCWELSILSFLFRLTDKEEEKVLSKENKSAIHDAR
jgi:hypothetical protein